MSAPLARRNSAISTVDAKCSGVCSVPAARMHDARIGRDQFAQVRQQSQPGRGMRVQDGATLDQEVDQAGIAIVEYSEPAGPPLGPLLDVGAGLQQHVDGRAIASLHGGETARACRSRSWAADRRSSRATPECRARSSRTRAASVSRIAPRERFCGAETERSTCAFSFAQVGKPYSLASAVAHRPVCPAPWCVAVPWLAS